MPTLRNPKHEKFAQLVASGMTAQAAFTQAGYNARQNAPRLRNNAHFCLDFDVECAFIRCDSHLTLNYGNIDKAIFLLGCLPSHGLGNNFVAVLFKESKKSEAGLLL
jgi:hypothetical protein